MRNKGLILVFATAIISGFSVFINKYGVSGINPYIFTFLKNALVALAIGSIFLAVKERAALKSLTKKQWLLLLVIGFIGGSAPFLLFFKGLSLTSAAQGGFIHKTMFIYVAILAAIFLKEKMSKNFIIGALLLILGNLFLLKKIPMSFGGGDLLIFSATILWAIENIISKYALKNIPGSIVAWGRMFFGSILILCFLVLSGQVGLIGNLSFPQIIWVSLTSIILFGYVFTWYSGLKYVPVSVATAILMFGSTVTTILSLVGGASISIKEAVAGILMIVSLLFIIRLSFLRKPAYLPTGRQAAQGRNDKRDVWA